MGRHFLLCEFGVWWTNTSAKDNPTWDVPQHLPKVYFKCVFSKKPKLNIFCLSKTNWLIKTLVPMPNGKESVKTMMGTMMTSMECEKKSNMVVETTMERWGYMFSFIPFGVLGVEVHYNGHFYVVTLHLFS